MKHTESIVRWGRHRLRMMPGWRAQFRHVDYTVDQEADVRARRRDGRGPVELALVRQPAQAPSGRILDATSGEHPFSLDGTFDVYHEGVDTAEQAGFVLAAAQLACMVHEIVEWTTVDGLRLANPHPEGDAQWEWVMDRCLGLFTDYATRWPAPEGGDD